MGQTTERAKAIIDIDGQLAAEEMVRLKKRSKDLRAEINKLYKEENVDVKTLAEKEKTLNKINKQQKRLQIETRGVNKEMKKMKGNILTNNKIWAQFKSILPIVSIGAIAAGIFRLSKNLYNLSKQMQADNIRANVVFGNSLGYVEEKAADLSKKMGVTIEEFKSMATATADLLIPLNFSRQQAAEMSVQLQSLTGALDEWTGGSIGATRVSEILTGAMLGQMIPLKQLGVSIRKDSEEFRDLKKQIIEAEKVTGQQAEAMAILELIQRKTTDAQTAYYKEGNKLLRLEKNIGRAIRQTKENFIKLFELKPSEEIKKEQIQLNTLANRLASANISEEERLKLINKLNNEYPNFLKGLDTEKLTTEQIAIRLHAANEEYINRILLQQKQEEIDKAAKKAAKTLNNEISKQQKIENALSNAAIKLNASEQTLGKSFEEQLAIITPLAKEQEKQDLLYIRAGRSAMSLDYAIQNLNKAHEKTEKKQEKVNNLTEARIKLAEKLGIKLNELSFKEEKSSSKTDIDEKTLEKRQQYFDNLKQLQRDYEISQMKDIEAELARIDDKYEKIIEKVKASEELTQQEKDKIIEEYDALRSNEQVSALDIYLQKIEDKEVEAEKEKQEELRKIRENELKKLEEEYREKVNMAADYAKEVGGILGNAIADSKITAEQAAKEILLLSLRTLKNILQQNLIASITNATIGSLASTESIATWGLAGIAKAAFLIGLIEAAYQGVETALESKTNILGYASNRVEQRAKGKYTVTGADDGKTYQNIPYYGPVTQMTEFNKPALIAEQNKEWVIPGKHIDNIEMNFPWIKEALLATRIPQRQEGKYPEIIQQQTIDTSALDRLINILDRIEKNGIIALFNDYTVNDITKRQNIQSNIQSDIS